MKYVSELTIFLALGVLSCTTTTETAENRKTEAVSSDTIEAENTLTVSDTVPRISADDYPVGNAQFSVQMSENAPSEKKSGKTISYDKVWFSNDSLNQTLVFELYTDYHRMKIFHFYTNAVPEELMRSMELHVSGGELAPEEQKRKDFPGFLEQSGKINSSCFVSQKGFSLGDHKQKAMDVYGKPDKQSVDDGTEQLEWEFVGESAYDGKSNLKGKPVVKNSFGQRITMYFKNGKLIAHVLHNFIP